MSSWPLFATVVAVAGMLLTVRPGRRERAWGWSLQAVGLCLLGVAWLAAARR